VTADAPLGTHALAARRCMVSPVLRRQRQAQILTSNGASGRQQKDVRSRAGVVLVGALADLQVDLVRVRPSRRKLAIAWQAWRPTRSS
jgi:hypothetical protein